MLRYREIVNGRLMLFLRNDEVDARELWNKESEQECVVKADRFWDAAEVSAS